MRHFVCSLLLLFATLWTAPAAAAVTISFHSFNGSVVGGRYPHTFVVLEGTLENGQSVNANFGFTARRVSPAILRGPVEHAITTEQQKYVRSTNRHFTVPLTQAQYGEILAEVARWRDAPGKFYDLDTRNCIHFVGRLAQIAGLKVSYPEDMLRRPKMWLNHIAALNPRLGAARIP